jgi:hypothetical protein
MIPLTFGVAILDELTRHTHLKTHDAALLLAAIGTAYVNLVMMVQVHDVQPSSTGIAFGLLVTTFPRGNGGAA